jgi:translation elongation factor P/translation initiation factor 5A
LKVTHDGTNVVEQWAVLDKDGDYVQMMHQDDMETPLVEGSASALADVLDRFSDGSLRLNDIAEDGTFKMDDEVYQIVREEVRTFSLTPEDFKVFREQAKHHLVSGCGG